MRKLQSVFAGISVVAAGTALYAQNIKDLAPDNAFMIAGTSNASALMEKVRAMPAWSMWAQQVLKDQRKEMREDLIEEMPPAVKDFLEELGMLDAEKNLEDLDLPKPTGSVGFAAFPLSDELSGKKEPGMLAFADFGDEANRVHDLISRLRDTIEEHEAAVVDPFELLGREGFVFEFEVTIPDEPDFNFPPPQPGMQRHIQKNAQDGQPETRKEKMYLVRDDSRYFLCTDMIALGDALAQLDGDDVPDRFGETTAAQDMLTEIGSVDAFAAMRLQPLIQQAIARDQSGMAVMIVPMVQQLIGNVDGAAFGMRLSGPSAMAEMPFIVYMPNGKSGLSALLNTGAPRAADLPPFVGPQAFSYMKMAVQFSTLPEWFDQLLQNNPMIQMQLQQNQAMDQARSFVRQLSDLFGNEMHVATTVQRPIEADSVKNVMAVRCTDTQGFEEFLTKQAGGGAMEGRDFLGQRIYTMDVGGAMGVPGMPGGPGMGGPQEDMAIGIGAGYVVFGLASGVEQALRSFADDDARTLQASDDFARAVSVLPDRDVVAWGYSDTPNAIEAQMKSYMLSQQRVIEQMKDEFGEEFAAEMVSSQFEQMKQFVEQMDFDALRNAYGPSVWHMRSTDKGFVGSSLLLRPAEQN